MRTKSMEIQNEVFSESHGNLRNWIRADDFFRLQKRTSPELRYFYQVGEKLLRTERELREKTDAILLNQFINNKRKWFMRNERYNNLYYIPATNKIRKYMQENYREKRNLLLTEFSIYLTSTGKSGVSLQSVQEKADMDALTVNKRPPWSKKRKGRMDSEMPMAVTTPQNARKIVRSPSFPSWPK
ncbi:hypothetical protein CRM22_003082 [Opisthorchis felineus]|uniref:Uncharacterized protein n=1 Tax=Opisthorchis felineus TaxID=147828 RepID=A0A4S2M2X9_OPIFE|nr:hypothetical protein CRM22_003082 [Opisthorchis felineus]